MNLAEIKATQERVGAVPDGFWGPKSQAALVKHLRKLMPEPVPWPNPDDAAMTRFYGPPGDRSMLKPIEVGDLGLRYDGMKVAQIYCHRHVGKSLRTALEEIAGGPAFWILREYAGCYNDRNMRSSSRKSKHAWGVAVDFAPATNGLWTIWPEKATMPIEAIEAFARQGWINLGVTIRRDAMHFQATR
jgi:hypothetical protein